MTAQVISLRDAQEMLYEDIAKLIHKPYEFVLYVFPWGQAGSALAHDTGPEDWQRDILILLGKGLITVADAVRLAVASGHGIGKSALVAWIILWALSTCADTRGVVTANTGDQLRIKTWPELAKWHALAINRDWFTFTATSIFSAFSGHEKTWRCDAITWSEQNTEAIAGLHNRGKRAFAIFDEASSIPDTVWETIEGALTDADTELFWCVFGNPTRTSGRFREAFAGGAFSHRWNNRQIDSRSVRMTNKTQIAEWVKDYGEDSDFVRVRIRGIFPRAGTMQFIDSERVEQAIERPLVDQSSAPLAMGVDVARHGEDLSVIRLRKGLDARSIAAIKVRIPDLMQLASRILEAVNLYKPRAVFVDGTGLGWGVVDRLNSLGVQGLVGVDFGANPDRGATADSHANYANKRAEMWGAMKDWLRAGCLPEDRELAADLTGVEYGYNVHDAILLEKKEHMRQRGLRSPDDGDALALTFAHPVALPNLREERHVEDMLRALRRRVV